MFESFLYFSRCILIIQQLNSFRCVIFIPMAYFLTLTASNVEDDRPHILWSMHFTLNDWSELDLTDQAVENVLVCSDGGDAEIDLDKCVPEVKVPKICENLPSYGYFFFFNTSLCCSVSCSLFMPL